MGGGMVSPQDLEVRRKQEMRNQLLNNRAGAAIGMQGLSGLGGLHYQGLYNRALQQQGIEEMKRMYPVERDLRLAEEAMRNPYNEGMMIKPIVEEMKRDIDKVDICTYLQAKTDDWLRGVEL